MSDPTHARVAEYRGADAQALGPLIEQLRAEAEAALADPPPGLEALRQVLVLQDEEAGRVVAITLFEGEEGAAEGARTLDRRSASQAGGVRVESASYTVALQAARP